MGVVYLTILVAVKGLKAMYKINPSLHKSLCHMKRVGILSWILGWEYIPMLKVFQRLKITYTPFKDKINYKINKLNTWLSI